MLIQMIKVVRLGCWKIVSPTIFAAYAVLRLVPLKGCAGGVSHSILIKCYSMIPVLKTSICFIVDMSDPFCHIRISSCVIIFEITLQENDQRIDDWYHDSILVQNTM